MFGFQPNVCDSCHDLLHKATSFKKIANVFIKENSCRIFFKGMIIKIKL